MVAAILAIIGYSVNDTVVVFDRIREELRINPNGTLRDVVNLAINRVFSRSLMTSFTTFLAALSLFIFGGGVLRELAFTFLIGIITGTFSSICIAAQIFYWWHKAIASTWKPTPTWRRNTNGRIQQSIAIIAAR